MMSKYFLGIDLGAKGGFCLMSEDREILLKRAMPEHPIDGGIDHYEVEGFLAQCKGYLTHSSDKMVVATEKLHSIYGASAKSNYTFGSNNGYVDGLLHIWFGRDTKRIIARRWQKQLFEDNDIEEMKRKDGKRDTKTMSILAITGLYPNEDFRRNSRCKISHDGIIDAVGISLYVLNGGE
jgi:hypothetical protein